MFANLLFLNYHQICPLNFEQCCCQIGRCSIKHLKEFNSLISPVKLFEQDDFEVQY